MGLVDRAKELGRENCAVAIDDHTDASLSPATLEVHVVALGTLPRSHQCVHWMRRPPATTDILADVAHAHAALGHHGPFLEPEVGEIAGVSIAKFPPVPAHELGVLLREAIEPRMTL